MLATLRRGSQLKGLRARSLPGLILVLLSLVLTCPTVALEESNPFAAATEEHEAEEDPASKQGDTRKKESEEAEENLGTSLAPKNQRERFLRRTAQGLPRGLVPVGSHRCASDTGLYSHHNGAGTDLRP